MGEEGVLVTVEGSALAETTGLSREEPNPSPEETC